VRFEKLRLKYEDNYSFDPSRGYSIPAKPETILIFEATIY
jgi:hypothetical protein